MPLLFEYFIPNKQTIRISYYNMYRSGRLNLIIE